MLILFDAWQVESTTFLVMESYTKEERIQIVELFIENGRSVKNVWRKLRAFYSQNNRPSESTIRRIVEKFYETGSVLDRERREYSRSGRSEKHIDMVRESVAEGCQISICLRSQQFWVNETTTWRIMWMDFALKAYKIHLTQQLKSEDHS